MLNKVIKLMYLLCALTNCIQKYAEDTNVTAKAV